MTIPSGIYLRVAEGIRDMRPLLDSEFVRLRSMDAASSAFSTATVTCVNRLAQLLRRRTGQYKLSLASKYVHYHAPSVPIFDRISFEAFRALAQCPTRGLDRYEAHVRRFQAIAEELKSAGFRSVNARTVDDFVLWWWT